MTFNYNLNWSNDTLKPPFTLTAGTIDTTTTSLALTGKSSVNWGERVQENLIRLLENFASNTAPPSPTSGQLWYDSGNNQLKLRTVGNVWVVVWPQASTPTPTAPTPTAPTPTPTAPTPTPTAPTPTPTAPTPTPTAPTPTPTVFTATSLTSAGNPGTAAVGTQLSVFTVGGWGGGVINTNVTISGASLTAGSLPPGTSITIAPGNTAVYLTGVLSTAGTYQGTIRVTNNAGASPSFLDRTFYVIVTATTPTPTAPTPTPTAPTPTPTAPTPTPTPTVQYATSLNPDVLGQGTGSSIPITVGASDDLFVIAFTGSSTIVAWPTNVTVSWVIDGGSATITSTSQPSFYRSARLRVDAFSGSFVVRAVLSTGQELSFTIQPVAASTFTAVATTSVGSPGNLTTGGSSVLLTLVTSNMALSGVTLQSGSLPPGMTLTTTSSTNAAIQGVPSTAGTFSGTIRVTQNTGGTPTFLDRTFYVIVTAGVPTPTIVGAQIRVGSNTGPTSLTLAEGESVELYVVLMWSNGTHTVPNIVNDDDIIWSGSQYLNVVWNQGNNNVTATALSVPSTQTGQVVTATIYSTAELGVLSPSRTGTLTATVTNTGSPTPTPTSFTATTPFGSSNPAQGTVGSTGSGYIIEANLPLSTATVQSGSLPPGGSIYIDGNEVWITGQPTTAGNYSCSIRVSHGTAATPAFIDLMFYMTIAPPATSFTATAISSGGDPIYTSVGSNGSGAFLPLVSANMNVSSASLQSGSLPPGTSLTTNSQYAGLTGAITGAGGTYSGTIRVNHGTSATPAFIDVGFYIVVSAPFSATALSSGGSPIYIQTGGSAIFSALASATMTLSSVSLVSGTLPPGTSLIVSSSYAGVYGTATTAGTYSGTIRVNHGTSATPAYVDVAYSIVVTSPFTAAYIHDGGLFPVNIQLGYTGYDITIIEANAPISSITVRDMGDLNLQTPQEGLSLVIAGNYVKLQGGTNVYGERVITLRVAGFSSSPAYVDVVFSIWASAPAEDGEGDF